MRQTKRVLIAEHDEDLIPTLLYQVEDAFEMGGFSVEPESVTSIAAALTRLREGNFDIVITDWVWPADADPNGGEKFPGGQTIAARAVTADCSVLVITRRHSAYGEALEDANVEVVLHWDDLATGPDRLITAVQTLCSADIEKSEPMRRVFVIYGHDLVRRDGLSTFLRDVGLRPFDFDQAKTDTVAAMKDETRPVTTFDVVVHGVSSSDCALALLTPDEEVRPAADRKARTELRSRPNVVFEAGLAYAQKPSRTAMVRFGGVTTWSDVDGIQYLPYPDSLENKRRLIGWLKAIGLDIDDSDEGWRSKAY